MRPKFSDVINLSKRQRGPIYGTFTLFRSQRDGGPVLVEDATWRDINGFMIQAMGYRLLVIFRRWGKK